MQNNLKHNIGVRSGISENNHVSIKFPNYFESPSVWFIEIEAIFQLSNITRPKTMFLNLISNVFEEFQEYLDFNSEMAYENFKEVLILTKRKSTSYHKQQIFKKSKYHGERQPSEIIREISRHSKQIDPQTDTNNNVMLRCAFIQSLPKSIAQHLTLQDSKSIKDLGLMADKLMNVKANFEVQQISQSSNNHTEIISMINDLKTEI